MVIVVWLNTSANYTHEVKEKLQQDRFFFYNFAADNPGCFTIRWAENIPVEPDQGNACAGKAENFLSTPSLLLHTPFI